MLFVCPTGFPNQIMFELFDSNMTDVTSDARTAPTNPEHLNSLPVFSGCFVSQSLVFCAGF
jgi:hypothetical protein